MELQEQLENELDRLSKLIDGVAESGSAKSMRQALTAAGQLARLRERMIDRREPQDRPENDSAEATQKQKLESLRHLVSQHAESLGYVKRE